MDYFRRLFIQTRQHLKGLSLSQRLAIGACVGLIGVSLLLLVNWAKSPELVPLLDQPMTAEELVPIQQRLDIAGVPYEVTGDVIRVPAESRLRLIAMLGQNNVLPKDISIGFNRILEDSSPWSSMEEQGRLWSLALSNELAGVLREFDGIESARVFIDKTTKRTIGAAPVTPTASIFVKLKSGVSLDRGRVRGLASIVSGAVGGLDLTKVQITDATTGLSYSVPEPDDLASADDLEDRRRKEKYFADNIRGLLGHIPGLLVLVHAELNPAARQVVEKKHGKPVLTEESRENVKEQRRPAEAGPGVVPNTSQAIAAGPMSDEMEKSSSESTYDAKVDETVTTTVSPRNEISGLSASVNVPRSYLAEIFKKNNEGKEPTDAELDGQLWQNEQTKIRDIVITALGTTEESVVVRWFHDGAVLAMGPVAEAGGSEGMMTLVRTYGGKAGLGALAVISLLMMLMMVRKVGEGPVLPGEEPPPPGDRRKGAQRAEKVFTGEDIPVGRAEATEHLLEGREVDENTLRIQEITEQVSELVREDPETSVSILRRWVQEARK